MRTALGARYGCCNATGFYKLTAIKINFNQKFLLKSAGWKIIHVEGEICKYFQLSEQIHLSTPKPIHYAKRRVFFEVCNTK